MLLASVWEWLEIEIFGLPSITGERALFNFYRDADPAVDRPGAALIRRQNLYRYLASFQTRPLLLALGEAPGWRGARFSGIPFTSEAQLLSGRLPFGGGDDQPPAGASSRGLCNAILAGVGRPVERCAGLELRAAASSSPWGSADQPASHSG